MDDTICAISTALGIGAISIIRLSGHNAIKITNKIFSGKDLTKVASHTINYGKIIKNKEVIDEVLVSVMKNPKTYTLEDVVEINCHGGIVTTNKVLELLLENGARIAEPGEFTKRAFLNGRIDLTQAEAVDALLKAKSDKASSLAINNIEGLLAKQIRNVRKDLVELLANIEVNIDYPEYEDALVMTNEILLPKLTNIKKELENILLNSQNSKIIVEGIDVAIVGRPNVGKSSILNALLDEDKAIVTNVAGTTRDIINGSTIINNLQINFIDTAGIRKTKDIVEQIGVKKSLDAIKKADLIILVLNNNEKLTEEDKELINMIDNNNYIIFINKCDLENKLDYKTLNGDIVLGNSVKPKGLDNLKKKITEMFNVEKIATKDITYLSNIRQVDLVKRAHAAINSAIKNAKKDIPVDMIAIDIRNSWELLGQIIGENYQDELLDELFTNFCLGK